MNNSIKKGYIYFVNLPNNNSNVQKGKRPALILGVHGAIVNIIPLTSKLKRMDLLEHLIITTIDKHNIKHNSNALLEQITTISKDNVLNYYGTISEYDKEKINDRIKEVINI